MAFKALKAIKGRVPKMLKQNAKRNVDFSKQIIGLFKVLGLIWILKWSKEGAF
jgi:hypothetical protein